MAAELPDQCMSDSDANRGNVTTPDSDLRRQGDGRQSPTIADTVATGVLTAVAFIVAAFSAVAGVFSLFAFDRCSSTVACNYDAAVPALWCLIIANAVVWVGGVIVVVVFRSRSRRTWWVPLIGLLVLGAIWVVYVAVVEHAAGG